jgi:hypothetical protein
MRRAPLTSAKPVDEQPALRSVSLERERPGVSVATRPSGPAAAVLLAAGIACFALGLLSILAAASASISDGLTLSKRVGEASGLSTISAVTFLLAWGGLAVVWRNANPPLVRVAALSGALVALGLLATFPPVFNLFGG